MRYELSVERNGKEIFSVAISPGPFSDVAETLYRALIAEYPKSKGYEVLTCHVSSTRIPISYTEIPV